jgi:hypothetical protein
MIFKSRKSSPGKATKAQMLGARPLRLVDVEPKEIRDGAWRLTVPLKPAKWAAWVLRVPDGATKTFELDPLGKFVWDACDGRTPVRQIIRKLAKHYNLNDRAAEVATTTFLHTLAKKSLIGMSVKKTAKSK